MAQTDSTGWRLRTIIICTTFLFSMYLVSGFFVVSSAVIHTPETGDDIILPTNSSDASSFKLSAIGLFLNTLTFAWIDNWVLSVILNFILGMCWIVNIFLLYTLVRDWSPW